jgi:phage terminase large subunit
LSAQLQIEVEEFPAALEFIFQPHRYKVAYGGRGGGKSWAYARALLLQGIEKPLRVLCAREVQKSIKDSVHKLLSDQIEVMGLSGHYRILQNEIRGKNGTEFAFVGLASQTTDSIKSYEGIDRCWVEEAHRVSKRSWDILQPTIRKDGSEIWVSLNPELDTDETYKRFIVSPPASAKVVKINYSENPWFPVVLKEERTDMQRQVDKGAREQDEYDNIWEGTTRVVLDGAIWGKELIALKATGRLTRVPHDPLLKVHCIYDLGWNDSTAILMVQRQGSEIRVIDYIEDSHRTIVDYVKSEEGREDLSSRNYNWGTDWLPHDGYSKSVLSSNSAYDYLKTQGRNVDDSGVPNDSIEKGIEAARLLLPRVVIDEEKAGLLFNRLSRYKRRINARTGVPDAPEHDENSHGSDGFRYLAMVADQLTNSDLGVIKDPYESFRGYSNG